MRSSGSRSAGPGKILRGGPAPARAPCPPRPGPPPPSPPPSGCTTFLSPPRASSAARRGFLRGRLPAHAPHGGGVSAGRWSRPVRQRGAGPGRYPCIGHSRRRTRRRAGDGESVTGRGLGLAGTIVVHGVAVLVLAAGPGTRKPLPPTYTVRLV